MIYFLLAVWAIIFMIGIFFIYVGIILFIVKDKRVTGLISLFIGIALIIGASFIYDYAEYYQFSDNNSINFEIDYEKFEDLTENIYYDKIFNQPSTDKLRFYKSFISVKQENYYITFKTYQDYRKYCKWYKKAIVESVSPTIDYSKEIESFNKLIGEIDE